MNGDSVRDGESDTFDLVLDGGTFFDGTGADGAPRSLGIRDGRIVAISKTPLGAQRARQHVDATGKWVMPGFVDIHTHYDAEVEAAPGLTESLRHGVTTVVMGSCSLGAALSTPLDIADMFTRVEAVPREHVLPLLEERKTWSTAAEYRAHLESLPLGPNVATFLGHSDLRCSVLGLSRSVSKEGRPTRAERGRMEELLRESLDAGFLGLSVNTNFWDKLGGTRERSKPLPSAYASWGEIDALASVVRERGRVLQAIPNISAKYDALLFLYESAGIFRRKLRTSIVSIVDVRSARWLHLALGALARISNVVFRGDVRFQALPTRFEMFVDGLDAPIFEEIGAGTAALHLESLAERRDLLRDPTYRSWFRRQWTSFFAPRVFHRDFAQSKVVGCPDASLVGKSFADIAKDRKRDVVEVFLDLCAEHGDALRWFTTVGNDRPDALRRILSMPDITVGFSDAGAHLRNMAFYNAHLFVLRIARDAARDGVPFISIGRAVHRCTGEIGAWLGLDAGTLRQGSRADVVVVDPTKLDEIDTLTEAPIPELGGFMRMVRRNEGAVPAVVVRGKLAVRDGVPVPEVGRERGFGTFLGA